MPGMDGVVVTREIKRLVPSTQIIILTSYYEDENIFNAIKAGALSYLLKDSSPQELVISEPTVRTHVANILSKLHLTDRTQAAIYALQQRLVPLQDALEKQE